MEHTEACLKRQEDFNKAVAEWEAKWPDYCNRCGGAGAFHYSGSREEPPSDDICICQENGLCPRCGAKTFEADEDYSVPEVCSACGWDMNEPDVNPKFYDFPYCDCDNGYSDYDYDWHDESFSDDTDELELMDDYPEFDDPLVYSED